MRGASVCASGWRLRACLKAGQGPCSVTCCDLLAAGARGFAPDSTGSRQSPGCRICQCACAAVARHQANTRPVNPAGPWRPLPDRAGGSDPGQHLVPVLEGLDHALRPPGNRLAGLLGCRHGQSSFCLGSRPAWTGCDPSVRDRAAHVCQVPDRRSVIQPTRRASNRRQPSRGDFHRATVSLYRCAHRRGTHLRFCAVCR